LSVSDCPPESPKNYSFTSPCPAFPSFTHSISLLDLANLSQSHTTSHIRFAHLSLLIVLLSFQTLKDYSPSSIVRHALLLPKMPTTWDAITERQLLLLIMTEGNFTPSKDVWQRVATLLASQSGSKLTVSAVSYEVTSPHGHSTNNATVRSSTSSRKKPTSS
jgi:hypothetical protein